jgi:hypothetical protein
MLQVSGAVSPSNPDIKITSAFAFATPAIVPTTSVILRLYVLHGWHFQIKN